MSQLTSSAGLGAVIGLVAGGGLLLMVAVLIGSPSPRGRRPEGRLAGLVRRADVPRVTPAGVVGACLAAGLAAGAVALAVTAVPAAALIAAVVAGTLPPAILRRRAGHRVRALREGWPEAIDVLVSAVRAGMSLPEAVSDLARSGPPALRSAFTGFAVEYRATGSFASSLDWLQDRLADPVADRVVASLRMAREVGGTDLGVVLRTLSALLREDARTRGEIEARQSWTVAAARMAVAAPWVTLALLCTRPEAVRAYGSTSGAVVLLMAAAMSGVAYRVMLRIGRLPVERRMAS